MRLTVWTVTSDTDSGTRTTAHATERDAYEELRRRFVRTASQDSHFEHMIDAGLYRQLMEWVSSEAERSGCDSYSVEAHAIETAETEDTPLDAAYREAASEEYSEEGRIEIDSNAGVSYGDDDGAYVAAWVWVERSSVALARSLEEDDESNVPGATSIRSPEAAESLP